MHVGFLKSWTSNGLDTRVVARIREIIHGPGFNATLAKIAVTGESQLEMGE